LYRAIAISSLFPVAKATRRGGEVKVWSLKVGNQFAATIICNIAPKHSR
jgi:hypothetical protein